MPSFSVHPTTRVVNWFLLLIAVQCLNGLALAAAFLLLPALGRRGLQRAGRLVWRVRWLLLTLLVVFSWGVAGEPLWEGAAAPTLEGLRKALTHLGRLLLVLIAVSAFLDATPLADLLVASHTLLKPLRRIGLDPDRGVVRLMLVLRYVETLPRPRDWRSLLDVPGTTVGESLELDQPPLRWLDFALTLILGLVVAYLCFRPVF